MTTSYTAVPTSQQWRKDMGVTGVFGKSEFPALERISELLEMYSTVNYRATALKYELLLQVYRHTEYIRKHEADKAKLGTKLSSSQAETVQALYYYLWANLIMGKDDVEDFGRDVDPHGRNEDDGALLTNTLQWYQDKAARRQFKLSFRSGIAHRWTFDDTDLKAELKVYDTDTAGDAIEARMSLYAMDTSGRIYCHGKEDPEHALKHSSFLAGGRTLAAGTLRVEQGHVVWVTGKSGHYRPTVQQMLNLLERLRGYQVDLRRVTVFRENYGGLYGTSSPRHFEPCAALTLLEMRRWPGNDAYSMRVG